MTHGKSPATYDNISDAMRAIVDSVHALGLEAWMHTADATWVYFTDGTRIGYAQQARLEGLTISTVHVPNTQSGTGFRLDRPTCGALTQADVDASFAHCPSWANRRDRDSVRKWADWETYNAKSYLKHVKIEAPRPMTDEEKHAAHDLALYTVNTSSLHPAAQEIVAHRKAGRFSDKLWEGHAKLGRAAYEKEMGHDAHTALFFQVQVIRAAAKQIADHYAD